MDYLPQSYEKLTTENIPKGLAHVIELTKRGNELTPQERKVCGQFVMVAHLWLLNRIADTRK